MTPWFFKCSIKGPRSPPLKRKQGHDAKEGEREKKARLVELLLQQHRRTKRRRIKGAMLKHYATLLCVLTLKQNKSRGS